LEGGRKITSIGNDVVSNALAKARSTAMDRTMEPGGVGGLRRILKARNEVPRIPG
jgi:hypothetical protein